MHSKANKQVEAIPPRRMVPERKGVTTKDKPYPTHYCFLKKPRLETFFCLTLPLLDVRLCGLDLGLASATTTAAGGGVVEVVPCVVFFKTPRRDTDTGRIVPKSPSRGSRFRMVSVTAAGDSLVSNSTISVATSSGNDTFSGLTDFNSSSSCSIDPPRSSCTNSPTATSVIIIALVSSSDSPAIKSSYSACDLQTLAADGGRCPPKEAGELTL